MNVKIQGGGSGTYSNSGSCSNVIDYLEHEDKKQLQEGKEIEPFFNHKNENIKASEIIYKIDQNKGQLTKKDAKFFVLTISPSESEILAMGKTQAEQSQNFKEFIKNEVAEKYSQNFKKNLNKDDLLYYSKIHIERKGQHQKDMHAHIVISRKTQDNRIKISPQSNHRGTGKGAVRGGFDRVEFFREIEKSFDSKFQYDRNIENSFDYQNAMKKGSIEEIEIQLLKAKEQENYRNREQVKQKNLNRSR